MDSTFFEDDTAALFVETLSVDVVAVVVVAVVTGLLLEGITMFTLSEHTFVPLAASVTLLVVLVFLVTATAAVTLPLAFPLFAPFGSGGFAVLRVVGGAFR